MNLLLGPEPTAPVYAHIGFGQILLRLRLTGTSIIVTKSIMDRKRRQSVSMDPAKRRATRAAHDRAVRKKKQQKTRDLSRKPQRWVVPVTRDNYLLLKEAWIEDQLFSQDDSISGYFCSLIEGFACSMKARKQILGLIEENLWIAKPPLLSQTNSRRISVRLEYKLKTRLRMSAKRAGHTKTEFCSAALMACTFDPEFRSLLLQAAFEDSKGMTR